MILCSAEFRTTVDITLVHLIQYSPGITNFFPQSKSVVEQSEMCDRATDRVASKHGHAC